MCLLLHSFRATWWSSACCAQGCPAQPAGIVTAVLRGSASRNPGRSLPARRRPGQHWATGCTWNVQAHHIKLRLIMSHTRHNTSIGFQATRSICSTSHTFWLWARSFSARRSSSLEGPSPPCSKSDVNHITRSRVVRAFQPPWGGLPSGGWSWLGSTEQHRGPCSCVCTCG
jgi:hypothetical protein